MSVQLPSRTIHCQMNRSTVATEKCTKQLIGERRFKPWISLLELEYAHCTEISCRQTNTCTLFFSTTSFVSLQYLSSVTMSVTYLNLLFLLSFASSGSDLRRTVKHACGWKNLVVQGASQVVERYLAQCHLVLASPGPSPVLADLLRYSSVCI